MNTSFQSEKLRNRGSAEKADHLGKLFKRILEPKVLMSVSKTDFERRGTKISVSKISQCIPGGCFFFFSSQVNSHKNKSLKRAIHGSVDK